MDEQREQRESRKADNVSIALRKTDIMHKLLAGYTLRECAQMYELSYQAVRHYCDEHFMTELRTLSTTVYGQVESELTKNKLRLSDRMLEASDKALDKLIELMDSASNDKVKLEAANSVLDRTAEGARNKRVQEEVSHKFIDPLFLVHAAKTAQEIDNAVLPPAPGETINGQS